MYVRPFCGCFYFVTYKNITIATIWIKYNDVNYELLNNQILLIMYLFLCFTNLANIWKKCGNYNDRDLNCAPQLSWLGLLPIEAVGNMPISINLTQRSTHESIEFTPCIFGLLSFTILRVQVQVFNIFLVKKIITRHQLWSWKFWLWCACSIICHIVYNMDNECAPKVMNELKKSVQSESRI